MASDTVFDALVTVTPSTSRLASIPLWMVPIPRAAFLFGVVASASVLGLAGLLLASAIVIVPAEPLVLLTRDKRAVPSALVNTLAITPRSESLIAAFSPARLASV